MGLPFPLSPARFWASDAFDLPSVSLERDFRRNMLGIGQDLPLPLSAPSHRTHLHSCRDTHPFDFPPSPAYGIARSQSRGPDSYEGTHTTTQSSSGWCAWKRCQTGCCCQGWRPQSTPQARLSPCAYVPFYLFMVGDLSLTLGHALRALTAIPCCICSWRH